MASYDFERFLESFFGDSYMAWHDGLALNSLRSLEREERIKAEEMLLANIDSGDDRIFVGLGELHSKRAVDGLKKVLHKTQGETLVKVAIALWQIEEFPEAVKYIIKVLKNDPSWSDRMRAAIDLRHIHSLDSVNALLDALNDINELVICHSISSLLYIYDIYKNPYESHPLAIDIMSDNIDEREKAIEEIKELIKREGTSPEKKTIKGVNQSDN